jgi:hypothetical protein
MFRRTLLFVFVGAIGGAVAFVVAPWSAGDAPLPTIYLLWLCLAGMVGGVLTNLMNEWLGFYKVEIGCGSSFAANATR